MANQRWTNATLRAHLGERGFLQDGATVRDLDRGQFETNFVRGNDTLTLVEYSNDQEPIVVQNGYAVDVSNIGYRNEQLQHDKLRGD